MFAAIGFIVASAVIVGCGTTDGGAAPSSTLGSYRGIDSGRVDLSPDGRPVVLALVANWCAPCHRELPILEKLHRERGPDVRVVAIAIEEEQEATRRLISETGITFPVGSDADGRLLEQFGFVTLPGTVVLDGSGGVVKRFNGAVDRARLDSALRDAQRTNQ